MHSRQYIKQLFNISPVYLGRRWESYLRPIAAQCATTELTCPLQTTASLLRSLYSSMLEIITKLALCLAFIISAIRGYLHVLILILLVIKGKRSISTEVLIKTMTSQADKKSCYLGICTPNCLQNKLPCEKKFLRSLQCLYHRNRKEGYVASKLPCTAAVEGI